MGHIQRKHLSDAKVLIPPSDLLEATNMVLQPLLDSLISCSLESRTLAALRDTLLPKLLSGDLHAPDVESFLEEEL